MLSTSPHRRCAWAGTAAAVVGAAGLGGCANAPTNTAPAAISTPADVKFEPTEATELKRTIEARGWPYVSNFVTRGQNDAPTAEGLYFIDPQTIVRTGTQVRVRTLSAYARAYANTRSTIDIQTVDCTQRTYQRLSREAFSDAVATQRVFATSQPATLVAVSPNTLGDTLLTNVCGGRFANAGTRMAPVPLPPAAPGSAPAPAPAPSARRGGVGSGFVIAAKRALTNAHVVASCSSIDVLLAGERTSATVRKRDAVNDLALLEVAALPDVAPPALRRQAVTGEPVLASGYPLTGLLSSDLTVTQGLVNALSGLGDNASHLQTSAAVQAGNSGGPLLDGGGNVVGVIVSKLNVVTAAAVTGDMAQNVNFAIKPEIVSLFLQSEKLPLRYADRGGNFDTAKLASLARGFTLKVECKP